MKLVSFSWFRTPCPRRRAVEYYTQHWPALFRHFPEVYPGWRMRWHVDEREVDLVAPCLEGLDFVDIEIMPRTDHMSVGHLWRAKPCWDPDVEYCAQNDCDAVPAPREALCRQEFLDTGYDAHVIRDSPDHTGQMMCGLCCWRAAAVRELWPTWDAFIADHERHDDWQYSQWYLLKALWVRMPGHKLTHLGNGAGEGSQDDVVREVPAERAALDARIPVMGGGFA